MAGVNRRKADTDRNVSGLPVVRIKPCVFISYRLADSDVAWSVAEFIMGQADCDVYLSDNDARLLSAVSSGNHEQIVATIDAGITESTHLLGVITIETKGSWWVPYEFGACRHEAYPSPSL